MIFGSPVRKPAHRNLLDWEKQFNTQINKIRYVIEQIIANFKTRRIMHTDYRRGLYVLAVLPVASQCGLAASIRVAVAHVGTVDLAGVDRRQPWCLRW
jgi:hypothetical protein